MGAPLRVQTHTTGDQGDLCKVSSLPNTTRRKHHDLMSVPTTPATADFSSSPLKRTKIVLLGDQSVGKTSLITRSVACPACNENYWLTSSSQFHVRHLRQYLSGYNRYRFPEQNDVLGRPDSAVTALGHCGPGQHIFSSAVAS